MVSSFHPGLIQLTHIINSTCHQRPPQRPSLGVAERGGDGRCADTLDPEAPDATDGRDAVRHTKLLDSLTSTIPFPLFFHMNCPCTCIFRVIYVFMMIKSTFISLFFFLLDDPKPLTDKPHLTLPTMPPPPHRSLPWLTRNVMSTTGLRFSV